MSDLNGYFDITDFGASPSNSASANNAAFASVYNNAINATTYAGKTKGLGGVIYVPPGNFHIDPYSAPVLTIGVSGVEIRGAGPSSILTSVTHSGATIYPHAVFSVATGTNSVKVRNLAFVGNGDGYAGALTTGCNNIEFLGGEAHKIDTCKFYQNRAYTVYSNARNVEVRSSRFDDVGYNDGSTHGSNYRTDAIFANSDSVAVRARNNFFQSTQYGAIHVKGAHGDASNNQAEGCFEELVWLDTGNFHTAGLNGGSNSQYIPGTTPANIYTSPATQFTIIGNCVDNAAGDGYSTAAWSHAILAGNNSVTTNVNHDGDCGLQVNPQGTTNPGLALFGNNAYNDYMHGTRFLGSGGAAPYMFDCQVFGNNRGGAGFLNRKSPLYK